MSQAKFTLEKLGPEYAKLFDTCVVKPGCEHNVKSVADIVSGGKWRYDIVAQRTGVPWWFIGLLHSMECSCSFKKHLHNGDPLSSRTTHVPAGRPEQWDPRINTWEDSAIDAIKHDGYSNVTDWSIENTLLMVEKYNGWGYRSKGINSPYLWSMSNHYSKGKYVADRVYDPNAVSKQVGVAVVLKFMKNRGEF